MARRSKEEAIDWETLERQYRLGIKSNKQLGSEFGVDDSSIGKRAKKYGWIIDKREEVDIATNSLLIQAASGNSNPNSTPTALEIKVAAQVSADVVLNHRRGLARLDAVKTKLLVHVESVVDNFKDLSDVIQMVRNPDENGVDKANDALRKVLGRSSVVDDLKKLAEIDEKVRKGEREAFGIDKEQDSGKGTVESLLKRIGSAA